MEFETFRRLITAEVRVRAGNSLLIKVALENILLPILDVHYQFYSTNPPFILINFISLPL
jgi:hypothetical protein